MLKLIEKTWVHRNDFDGVYECDKCVKHTFIQNGYDDDNYFRNVIPNFKCSWCEGGTNKKVEEYERPIKDWKVVE